MEHAIAIIIVDNTGDCRFFIIICINNNNNFNSNNTSFAFINLPLSIIGVLD